MEQLFLDLVEARRGHFKLESGHHSELWLDLDPLFASPHRIKPLVDALARLIEIYEAGVICGPLTGGAFLAQALAAALDREFACTERFMPAKSEGLYSAQYRLPRALVDRVRGQKVAIVDDVMSAGSAAVATVRELKSHGAFPVVVGALMLLGTRGAELCAKDGLPVEAVIRREFLVWPPQECPLCATGVPLLTPG